MKMLQLCALFFLAINISSVAQLTRGNWMVGGTGNFSFTNVEPKVQQSSNSGSAVTSSSGGFYSILLEPNVGYFVTNRFVIGLKISYLNSYSEGQSFNIKDSNLGLSPFIRYYLLKEDKNFNFFLEPSYNHFLNDSLGNSRGYSVKAGHVVFFNNAVGFETSINYVKSESDFLINDVVFIGLGFQIHL